MSENFVNLSENNFPIYYIIKPSFPCLNIFAYSVSCKHSVVTLLQSRNKMIPLYKYSPTIGEPEELQFWSRIFTMQKFLGDKIQDWKNFACLQMHKCGLDLRQSWRRTSQRKCLCHCCYLVFLETSKINQ